MPGRWRPYLPEAGDDVDDGGWVEFDGPLELLPRGRNTYTVLYLDDLLREAVATAATRRVEAASMRWR